MILYVIIVKIYNLHNNYPIQLFKQRNVNSNNNTHNVLQPSDIFFIFS
jgi:hypothetical protein